MRDAYIAGSRHLRPSICGPTLAARLLRPTLAARHLRPDFCGQTFAADICGQTIAARLCGPTFAASRVRRLLQSDDFFEQTLET